MICKHIGCAPFQSGLFPFVLLHQTSITSWLLDRREGSVSRIPGIGHPTR